MYPWHMTPSFFCALRKQRKRDPGLRRDDGYGMHRAFVRRHTSAIADRYFSFRQFTDPRFSTVLDSISMSKPLRSRYFKVITWPVPSRDTP